VVTVYPPREGVLRDLSDPEVLRDIDDAASRSVEMSIERKRRRNERYNYGRFAPTLTNRPD